MPGYWDTTLFNSLSYTDPIIIAPYDGTASSTCRLIVSIYNAEDEAPNQDFKTSTGDMIDNWKQIVNESSPPGGGSGTGITADNFQIPTIEIISSDVSGNATTFSHLDVQDWIPARSGTESKWQVTIDWSIYYETLPT